MGTIHRNLLNRYNQGDLFLQLGDEETSEFEKHVRFVYAIHSVLGYIAVNYHLFSGDVPTKVPMNPSARIDYKFWYPKHGAGAILSTEVQSGPIGIAQVRTFRQDPLYRAFELAAINPPASLELTLDSPRDGNEEFTKMIRIFHRACNDEAWKNRVPKFLRASAAR